MRGAENASEIALEFDGSGDNDTVPPCDKVPLSVRPFGTVPFRRQRDETLRSMRDAVRVDTFQMSGRKHCSLVLQYNRQRYFYLYVYSLVLWFIVWSVLLLLLPALCNLFIHLQTCKRVLIYLHTDFAPGKDSLR